MQDPFMAHVTQESPVVTAPLLQARAATRAWGRGLDAVFEGSLEWEWWAWRLIFGNDYGGSGRSWVTKPGD